MHVLAPVVVATRAAVSGYLPVVYLRLKWNLPLGDRVTVLATLFPEEAHRNLAMLAEDGDHYMTMPSGDAARAFRTKVRIPTTAYVVESLTAITPQGDVLY